MSFEEVEAIPLIGTEEHITRFHDSSQALRPAARVDKTSAIVLICAVVVSVTSFLLNGYALSFSFRTAKISQHTLNVNDLRHPSLYQGLDRVPDIKQALRLEDLKAQLSGNTAYDQPHGMGHGSSMTGIPVSQNNWRLPERITRVNSRHGATVYPHDDWVLFTEFDRVLMEFTLDVVQGGRECSFTAIFPERRNLQDRLLTIESDDPDLGWPLIQITLVPEQNMVDISKATWNTRPVSETVLGTLRVSFGTNDTTPSFSCPSGSLMQVELECLGRGCRVEYKNEDDQPILGIGLTRAG